MIYLDICESEDNITLSGSIITSPGYPTENYPNYKTCEKVIRLEEGKSIRIRFLDNFEIESHSSCNYDFIEIINGTTYNSPSIGKFCGSTKPQPIIIHEGTIRIKFRSDSSVNKKGFAMKISQIALGEGN